MTVSMLEGRSSGDSTRRPMALDAVPVNRSNPSMQAVARTYRLAIGLFDGHPPLFKALDDLALQGLCDDSLCLIGHEQHIRPGHDAADTMARNVGLFEGLRLVAELFPPVPCAASAGALFDDLCAPLSFPAASRERYPMWLTSHQYERLQGHVGEGGLILIVSSTTPTQQDASSRILLRHSQNGVQTHDFTVRTPRHTTG